MFKMTKTSYLLLMQVHSEQLYKTKKNDNIQVKGMKENSLYQLNYGLVQEPKNAFRAIQHH